MNRLRQFTRRQVLRMGTASLMASLLGLRGLRGRAFAATPDRSPGFRFIVANDLHYSEPACGLWMKKVVAQMKLHQADFCVLVGDLSENGREDQLAGVCKAFDSLGIPVHKVIGNHDYLSDGNSQGDHAPFLKTCGSELNYQFTHNSWQFLVLDTTEHTKVWRTHIQPHTLHWLDAHLPRLDPCRPTVLFTHFPLGKNITRPVNTDALLERLGSLQMRAIFNGHWHGLSESQWHGVPIVTSRCCSRWRENRDCSTQKGYFLCHAESGMVAKRFIPISFA